MAIWKTIYIFFQFQVEFSFFNLLNSVCKNWSTGMRRFSIVERAQQKCLVLFPQDFLICDARYSPVSLIKIYCSLHIIKHLTRFDNNVSIESLLEKCIETVRVLVVETERIQFL